jgi:hypothetical protein
MIELSLGGQIFKALYSAGIITPAKAKIMLILLKRQKALEGEKK